MAGLAEQVRTAEKMQMRKDNATSEGHTKKTRGNKSCRSFLAADSRLSESVDEMRQPGSRHYH